VVADAPAVGGGIVGNARITAEQRLEKTAAELAVVVVARDEGEIEQIR
jgi:hypothetical protein